jgi:hypothetical protein
VARVEQGSWGGFVQNYNFREWLKARIGRSYSEIYREAQAEASHIRGIVEKSRIDKYAQSHIDAGAKTFEKHLGTLLNWLTLRKQAGNLTDSDYQEILGKLW